MLHQKDVLREGYVWPMSLQVVVAGGEMRSRW